MRDYYYGFYRDYSHPDRPVILRVTDNVDSLSCETLGGTYPMLKLYITAKEKIDIANELALRYHASYIEIGDSARRKIHLK